MAEPTIQLGGGNWAGKTDNLLGYYKEGERFYKQDFTFSRSTTGTYTDSDGYIQEMPYNLNNNSEDLNSYTKLNVVVTSDDIISPRGTQDADKLETTSNNSYKLLKTNSVSFVSGVDYTFSFHAKKGTTDFIQLITTNTLFGATSEWANFDLNNGVVSLDNYGGASIEDVGNGWFRCSITSTCVSSGTDGWFVSVITSGTSTRAESTSNVVNVYAWGIQVVKGTTAKTYFPTTTRLNMPRVDYLNNSNGSLILEPQRSNLIRYSEDFSQWSAISSVINKNAISPSGDLNATTITDDGSGGSSGNVRIQAPNFSITASTQYTFSAYVKANPNTQIKVTTRNDDALRGGTFNISTLTFTPEQGTEIGSVESIGNGYYRIITTWTSGSDTSVGIGIGFPNITRDGTNSFILWGAQVEKGSYATTLINTSGSSVTRNADACSITNVADRINSSEGVLFGEIRALDSSNIFDFGLYGNTSTNQVRIGFFNNDVYASLYNGSYQTQMSAPNDLSDFTKIAFKYKENDFALWVNGVEVATDTSGTTFNSGDLVKLNLSAQNGTSSLVLGNVKDLRVYNTALTDAELITLTT